jgi:hypothetical protein
MTSLETAVIILLVGWLTGFSLHIGGYFIHVLLLGAIAVLIYRHRQSLT